MHGQWHCGLTILHFLARNYVLAFSRVSCLAPSQNEKQNEKALFAPPSTGVARLHIVVCPMKLSSGASSPLARAVLAALLAAAPLQPFELPARAVTPPAIERPSALLADFSIPKVDLPDASSFSLPKFDTSSFSLPKFDVPDVSSLSLPSDSQLAAAKDAAMASLQDFNAQLGPAFEGAKAQFGPALDDAKAQLGPAVQDALSATKTILQNAPAAQKAMLDKSFSPEALEARERVAKEAKERFAAEKAALAAQQAADKVAREEASAAAAKARREAEAQKRAEVAGAAAERNRAAIEAAEAHAKEMKAKQAEAAAARAAKYRGITSRAEQGEAEATEMLRDPKAAAAKKAAAAAEKAAAEKAAAEKAAAEKAAAEKAAAEKAAAGDAAAGDAVAEKPDAETAEAEKAEAEKVAAEKAAREKAAPWPFLLSPASSPTARWTTNRVTNPMREEPLEDPVGGALQPWSQQQQQLSRFTPMPSPHPLDETLEQLPVKHPEAEQLLVVAPPTPPPWYMRFAPSPPPSPTPPPPPPRIKCQPPGRYVFFHAYNARGVGGLAVDRFLSCAANESHAGLEQRDGALRVYRGPVECRGLPAVLTTHEQPAMLDVRSAARDEIDETFSWAFARNMTVLRHPVSRVWALYAHGRRRGYLPFLMKNLSWFLERPLLNINQFFGIDYAIGPDERPWDDDPTPPGKNSAFVLHQSELFNRMTRSFGEPLHEYGKGEAVEWMNRTCGGVSFGNPSCAENGMQSPYGEPFEWTPLIATDCH